MRIDYETVADMLRLTTIVYHNESSMDMNCVDELYGYINDAATDVHVGVFLNHDSKRVTVAFRGTNSVRDWVFNLQCCKHRVMYDRRLHRGYCKQLFKTNVYFRTIYRLKMALFLCPNYDVYVTGHSAGGALSTIFGYFATDDLSDTRITVVTFASPRTCNREFKEDFESKPYLKQYRVTNQHDLVTLTPMYKYHHVGEDIFLKSPFICCCLLREHTCNMYEKHLMNNRWTNEMDK
jgi:predicted lipase